MTKRTQKTATLIPYTPNEWNDSQRELHETTDLEKAMYQASCLAGGWYRRPVTIYMDVTPANDEIYQMRPADAPKPDGWRRIYTIDAHSGDEAR